MKQKIRFLFAIFFSLSLVSLISSCSSSSVDDGAELSVDDEFPMVDADTDALPNSLDDDSAFAGEEDTSSGDELIGDSSVDSLTSEAPTDIPGLEDQSSSDSLASSDGPSNEAPPSMNDSAPAEDPFSTDSYATASTSESPSTSESLSASSGGGGYTYTVTQGDTLMKVAYKCYGDIYQWKKILDDNQGKIMDPNSLVVGTTLQVDQPAQTDDYSGFERYLIQSGDTLGSISDDLYGTVNKWRHLWEINSQLIKDPNRIYAGFFLKYTMTQEEQMESERLKQMKGSAPLAGTVSNEGRDPSSYQEANAASAYPAEETQHQ